MIILILRCFYIIYVKKSRQCRVPLTKYFFLFQHFFIAKLNCSFRYSYWINCIASLYLDQFNMASVPSRYSDYDQKHKAPQINLPFKREYNLIYSYYIIDRSKIFDFDDDPRKIAVCKVCDDKIDIVYGSNMGSSYTIVLTNHLRKHGKEFQEYLVEYSLLLYR